MIQHCVSNETSALCLREERPRHIYITRDHNHLAAHPPRSTQASGCRNSARQRRINPRIAIWPPTHDPVIWSSWLAKFLRNRARSFAETDRGLPSAISVAVLKLGQHKRSPFKLAQHFIDSPSRLLPSGTASWNRIKPRRRFQSAASPRLNLACCMPGVLRHQDCLCRRFETPRPLVASPHRRCVPSKCSAAPQPPPPLFLTCGSARAAKA